MFSTYLLKALHTLTQGRDCWSQAFSVCKHLKDLGPDKVNERQLMMAGLRGLFTDRVRVEELWRTIACSKTFRGNFEIDSKASRDESYPPLFPNNLGGPVHRDPKAAQLVCILKEMVGDGGTSLGDVHTWVDEVFNLVQSHRGGQWPTKFAEQMAEEAYDCSCAVEACEKMQRNDQVPRGYTVAGWEVYKLPSNKLLQIDPRGDNITSMLTRHMVPRPDLKFQHVGPTSTPVP